MGTNTDFRVKKGLAVTTTATIEGATQATSTTTGALQVIGGASIGRDLFVHGNVNVGTANTNSSITVFNTTTGALNVRSIARFVSPNNANTITVRMLDSDVITFNGSAGQLFSISDSFTGTIFAVNDISGVPSIEVYDTGLVSIAEFTGNVGIGTTSTAAKLDVSGGVRITGLTTMTNNTNATSTTTGVLQVVGGAGIGRDLWVGGTIYGNISGTVTGTASQVNTVQQTANANYFLTFVDSNNASAAGELVYTTSSFSVNPATGNVGIGTAAPNYKLHIRDSAPSIFLEHTGGADVEIHTNDGSGLPGIRSVPQSTAFSIQDNGNVVISRAAGNVGIGTSSPNERLEVAGNIHVSGADRSIYNRSNNALLFGTNNTERLRLNSSGNLLLGTTSDTDNTAAYRQVVTLGGGAVSGGGIMVTSNQAADGGKAFISAVNYSTLTGSYTKPAMFSYIRATADTAANFQVIGGCFISNTDIAVANLSVANQSLYLQNTGVNNTSGEFINSAAYLYVQTSGTTNVNKYTAYHSSYQTSVSNETISTFIDFNAAPFRTMSAGSSVTTRYGLLIDFAATNVTNAWGVYQSNASVRNYFAGNFGIGTTSPTVKLDVAGGTRITGVTTITNTTAASSTVTGALQVAGGVGIGGNLYVGGDVVANRLIIQLTTITTTLVETDDIIKTTNYTNATSTTTGALQVAGGAGIGRDLWVGGTIYGNIGGTTGSASQINTVQRTTDASHFVTFVDSNNASTTGELVYTTSSFSVNPATGNLGLGFTPSTGGYGISFQIAHSGYGGGITAQAIDTNNYPVNLTANAISSGVSTWKYFNAGSSSASRYQQVAGTHSWFTAPSGTAGNTITFTQAMTLDSSGNLGIGTTNPGRPLDVFGSGARIGYNTTVTSGVSLELTAGSPTQISEIDFGYWGTGFDASIWKIGRTGSATGNIDNFNIDYTATGVPQNRFMINASGSVGIGTTSTVERLDVRGNIAIGGADAGPNYLVFRGTTGDGPGSYNHTYIGERIHTASESSELLLFKGNDPTGSGPDRIRHIAGDHVFDTYTSALSGSFETVATSVLALTRMVIKSDGNVGIGTASPAVKLQVIGGGIHAQSLTAKGSPDSYVDGIGLMMHYADSVGYIRAYNNTSGTGTAAIVMMTGGTERLRITANGGIAFGGASNFGTSGQILTSAGDAPPTWSTLGSITAGTATNVTTIARTTNAAHFLTFVDSNNAAATAESVYTTSSFSINPGTGNIGIGTTPNAYKLEVNGSFAAVTKSFRIDHPTSPGHKLQYGSLESPYHGVRLTGRALLEKGKCTVTLPNYISALVKEEGINIQITNYGHNKVLYVKNIELDDNCFEIAGPRTGKLEFFWTFTAIRKDIDDLEVEV